MSGEDHQQERHRIRSNPLSSYGSPASPATRTPSPRVYLAALLILASLAIASRLLAGRIVARQQSTVQVVNTAGRQPVLAQRIVRLADEVSSGDRDAGAGRSEIVALAARMEAAQHQLSEGDSTRRIPPPTSPTLRAMYFEGSLNLQRQVAEFVSHARNFAGAASPTDARPHLAALREATDGTLLFSLNAAVSQYQAESDYDILHLRNLVTTLAAVMLVVLLLEGLLIYRPLSKRLTESMSALVQVSTTDLLTGVMNRRAFMVAAEREVSRADRQNLPLCVLIADLDHFKTINDTYGHPAGDIVLKHFAAVAAANLRGQDSLGRLGGEEFGIIMPGASLEGAINAANRIRERFASTTAAITPNAQRITATVSIGVAWTHSATILDLLAEADRLVHLAKERGRNRVEGSAVPNPEEANPTQPIAARTA